MVQPIPLRQVRQGHVMGLVFGPPGCGKTGFLCSSQTMRTLHLDVDDGAVGALNFPGDPVVQLPPTNIDLVDTIPIRDRNDFDEALKFMDAHSNKYQLLAIDTVTELQRLYVNELSNNSLQPTQNQWGAALAIMELLSRGFRHKPYHVFMAAHEVFREEHRLAGSKLIWRPYFRGQYSFEYAKHFSFIARYILQDVEWVNEQKVPQRYTYHLLQCHRQENAEGKQRGALAQFEPPMIDLIIDKIVNARKYLGLEGE